MEVKLEKWHKCYVDNTRSCSCATARAYGTWRTASPVRAEDPPRERHSLLTGLAATIASIEIVRKVLNEKVILDFILYHVRISLKIGRAINQIISTANKNMPRTLNA